MEQLPSSDHVRPQTHFVLKWTLATFFGGCVWMSLCLVSGYWYVVLALERFNPLTGESTPIPTWIKVLVGLAFLLMGIPMALGQGYILKNAGHLQQTLLSRYWIVVNATGVPLVGTLIFIYTQLGSYSRLISSFRSLMLSSSATEGLFSLFTFDGWETLVRVSLLISLFGLWIHLLQWVVLRCFGQKVSGWIPVGLMPGILLPVGTVGLNALIRGMTGSTAPMTSFFLIFGLVMLSYSTLCGRLVWNSMQPKRVDACPTG